MNKFLVGVTAVVTVGALVLVGCPDEQGQGGYQGGNQQSSQRLADGSPCDPDNASVCASGVCAPAATSGGAAGICQGVETGTNWTAQTSNVSGSLSDIHYADGIWVGVGSRRAITTSENGTTWEERTSNVQGSLYAVHHANNLWVAVGQNTLVTSLANIRFIGAITISENGTTWEAQTSNADNSILTDVHHANDLWVAVGSRGVITTSANGTKWTEQRSNVSDLEAIHYANNLWVGVGAGGAITTSERGTAWEAQTSNVRGDLESVYYANGTWVAVGAGGVITTSTNGTTWVARTSNVSGKLQEVYYANGLWVAAGSNFINSYTAAGGIITTSANGTTWAAQTSNVNGKISGLHYANGRWGAVGYSTATDSKGDTKFTGAIITSANGTAWAVQDSKIDGSLNTIYYGNGLWVAGGAGVDSADNAVGAITTAP